MSEPVLELIGLRKAYGALVVTDGVDLCVPHGELHALIGPNGAGKTTLMNQISGNASPSAGEIRLLGETVTHLSVAARARRGMARSFQISSVLPEFTVLENVALSVQARSGSSYRFWSAASREARLNDRAMGALAEVGLQDRAYAPAGQISHGEKRALEIAMALVLEPKILLLDEPMAGTGHEESERITALLRRLKGRYAIVLVEHDMQAVFALADRVSVLVYGKVIASGPPTSIRENAEVRAAYLGDEEFA
ncbi:MAG: ABC transporter ATP-binding protein [Beijerinckiaceae bacterium]|nr:ABC transporter ATP-binding protein [Beijerinckiaceae bacterium]